MLYALCSMLYALYLFCPHPLRFSNLSFRFATYFFSENTAAFDITFFFSLRFPLFSMLYALCSMLSTFFAPIPCVSPIAHFASLHIAFPKTPGRLILHSLFNYVLPYALCSMLYALCSLPFLPPSPAFLQSLISLRYIFLFRKHRGV